MGRSRSKKRAEERRKQQQKNRTRTIAVVAVVVAVLAGVLVIIGTRPVAVDVENEVLARYEGLPTSFTDRGFPILGNPDAPARIEEYSSFDCPSCRNFHENVTVNLLNRIRNGEASFTYVPVFGTGSIPNGDDAAAAAICAGEQGFFWEYHDLLFDWQGRYLASAFQPRRLEAGAIALDLDMDAFNECRNADRTDTTLDNASAAFAQSGSTGTPSVFVNGNQTASSLASVSTAIDVIMASAEPVPVEIIEESADESPAEETTEDEPADAGEEAEAASDEDEEPSDEEAEVVATADHEEGVKAFLEKRTPQFTGK